jgi:hypothetical protein
MHRDEAANPDNPQEVRDLAGELARQTQEELDGVTAQLRKLRNRKK